MTKFPYMPFYGNDFIRKTVKLTPEERWIYLHLLWLMWNNGGALDDIDDDNARAVGLTLRKWKAVKRRLVPYFIFAQGQFSQCRLLEVIDEVTQKSDKRRHAGIRGARARWEGYQVLKNGKGNAVAIKNDGKPYGKTMPGNDGKPYGKTMPSQKEDITSTSTVSAREEETTTETQPSPDGARATDGPAPPALQERPSSLHYLLDTAVMRRAMAKEGS
jgi:uncharacterized protein YdaU (DUF1376 family)